MTSVAPALDESTAPFELLRREMSVDELGAELGWIADQVPAPIWAQALTGPLEEVLSSPGKEFRSRLVTASYALAGGKLPLCPEVPAIVEILHAGSLVVDDIEDGSDLRRGAPSLHTTYGVPIALNAGNWLYFWAFRLIERLAVGEGTQLAMLRAMARALLACHYGQALDLSVVVDQLTRPEVPRVVRAATELKTGRLMQLAAEIGTLAAGADGPTLSALAGFGRRLGTGLQMLDDLGGLISPRRAHKGDEDLRLGRPSWPWAWAAELEPDVGYARLRELGREVRTGRAPVERLATRLRDVVGGSARARVHRHLSDALDALAGTLGSSEHLGALKQEIERMEKSYD